MAAAGAASAVGGIGGNLVSQFLARFFSRQETDPRRPDLNHDLLKLVSNAVVREVAACEREEGPTLSSAEHACLLVFGDNVGAAFEQLAHSGQFPNLAPLDVKDVKQLLADSARSESLPRVGTVDEWRQIVSQLNLDSKAGLEGSTETLLAQRLHARLWDAIHSELKQDFAGEGRAYAALHLSFMGEVLATLNTLVRLPHEQTQLTQELLNELQAHKTRAADPKVHDLLTLLTQDEAQRAAEFRQRFDHLDTQWGLALEKLTKIEVTVTQIDTKLDNLADILFSRLSEKDQEIGALKAQLQATLQRAAQAQGKGDTAAGNALEQIRKDGDPKKLGEFLDRQLDVEQPRLAEQQTNVIQLLRERAAVAYVTGEIARAEQCLQQILSLLPEDLDAINRLGQVYKLHGDLDAAERQYRRVLDLAPRHARTIGNLGLIAETRGQLNEAKHLHKEALVIDQQLGNLEGQARHLGNLGLIARTRGQLDEAERLHRESLAIFQQLGHLEYQANQLGNLGLIARTRGQLDEAERLHREALAIDQQLRNLEGQASDLGNLGAIALTRGQLDEAEILHREALAINQQLGRLKGQANQLGNLGIIAKQRGNGAEAQRSWTEARDLFAQVGMKPQLEQVQGWLDGLPGE